MKLDEAYKALRILKHYGIYIRNSFCKKWRDYLHMDWNFCFLRFQNYCIRFDVKLRIIWLKLVPIIQLKIKKERKIMKERNKGKTEY